MHPQHAIAMARTIAAAYTGSDMLEVSLSPSPSPATQVTTVEGKDKEREKVKETWKARLSGIDMAEELLAYAINRLETAGQVYFTPGSHAIYSQS